MHNRPHCVKQGEKDLQVSSYQAIVLMLFNDAETLTAEQILEATKIRKLCDVIASMLAPQSPINSAQGELLLTLQTLVNGKVRVMKKAPKVWLSVKTESIHQLVECLQGKDVALSDVLSINNAFSNPHRRVKVPQILLKETVGLKYLAYLMPVMMIDGCCSLRRTRRRWRRL